MLTDSQQESPIWSTELRWRTFNRGPSPSSPPSRPCWAKKPSARLKKTRGWRWSQASLQSLSTATTPLVRASLVSARSPSTASRSRSTGAPSRTRNWPSIATRRYVHNPNWTCWIRIQILNFVSLANKAALRIPAERAALSGDRRLGRYPRPYTTPSQSWCRERWHLRCHQQRRGIAEMERRVFYAN